MRKMAFKEIRKNLERTTDLVDQHSIELKDIILNLINNDVKSDLFLHNDGGKMLPIPVFSNAMLDHGNAFLLHLMLSRGSFETELDFRDCTRIKESLVQVKLVEPQTFEDEEKMKESVNELVRLAINKIFPITLGNHTS